MDNYIGGAEVHGFAGYTLLSHQVRNPFICSGLQTEFTNEKCDAFENNVPIFLKFDLYGGINGTSENIALKKQHAIICLGFFDLSLMLPQQSLSENMKGYQMQERTVSCIWLVINISISAVKKM